MVYRTYRGVGDIPIILLGKPRPIFLLKFETLLFLLTKASRIAKDDPHAKVNELSDLRFCYFNSWFNHVR